MIAVESPAPEFTLSDQFGRKVSLADLRAGWNVLLLFYPLDWTPTWSSEVPALEALVDRFEREARTRVVAISVDSEHCHANWGADLGGVSLPLLADFHPKGAVSQSYGVYLDKAGISDRATVIVDPDGIVRHASSVGPGGQRNVQELLDLATKINGDKPSPATRLPSGLSKDATLYVREGCRFCRAVERAATNLHCKDAMVIRDVVKDPEARRALDEIAGKGSKVPVLVQDGKALPESKEIIKALVAACGRR